MTPAYPKPASRKKTPPPAILAQGERKRLYDRTKGRCDWCGRTMAYESMDAHHRLRRGPGTWALSNIAGVHHDCHVLQPMSIHQNPEEARNRGFIVPVRQAELFGLPPIEIGGYLWILHDDGTRESMELPF